jgi:protoheme IX farnesyltransferase
MASKLSAETLPPTANRLILASLKKYYYLCKPGIVYGNVMTGVAGYLLGSRWHINWRVFLCLIFGMGLIIAAACVINNYLDQGIDAKMQRTKSRALVLGHISTNRAIGLALVLVTAGFGLISQTNLITASSGVVAFIGYVVVYGYSKRRSEYGTLVGTLPGSASLVAGYTAATDHLNLEAWTLFVVMVCWQMAHFYAIAIYRLSDYKAASIPVWPAVRGITSTKRQIKFFIGLFLLANLVLGIFLIKSYLFTFVMLVTSILWLRLALARTTPKSQVAWAKKVFLFSLVTSLTFSVFLAFAGLARL